MPDLRISELPAAASPGDADLAPLVQSSGAALETRRATVSQLRSAVLADRGAHVRDYGAVGDGVANDAPAIQAAINDLKTKGGGTLSFGPRVYRIASAIAVNGVTIRFQGAGFTESYGPGQGTWLKIDSTGFTPFTFTGDLARGSAVRDIGVTQVHTATVGAGWVPTNYDYVFRVEDCFGGVDFDNVFLASVNRGIYARNSGRVDIRRLRGQVFATGVEIDQCFDIPRIHSVHFWTFWSANNNVVRWQQANGDAMVFRRCDGVFIDQAFALGYRSMFRFSSSSAGITQKFYIGQAYADFVQYGVLIEADGTDGQIASFTHQGEIFNAAGAPLAGGAGIQVNASNTRVQAGNLRIDAVEDNAIRIAGSGNRMDVFSLRCVRYNLRNNGSPAVLLGDSGGAPPNLFYLGSPPLTEAANGAPAVNSDGNAVFTVGGPAGRVARPGLSVGTADTGLFQPFSGGLSASVAGTEVLRATSSAIQLGAAPGGHALEVATPAGGINRVAVFGSGAGNAVTIAAQGADANVELWLAGKGSGLLRTVTPAPEDNSSAVATTGWVKAQGYFPNGGAAAPSVTSVAGRTGDVTLTTADIGGFTAAARAAAPVASVAGKTGAVTLTTADIGGFATAAAAAAPVASVAGKTGVVTLTTADIGGFATAAAAAAPVASVAGKTGAVTLSTADIGGFATAAAAAAPVASVAGKTGVVTLSTADIGGFATAAAAAAPVASVAGKTGAVTLAVADVSGAAPLASPAFTGSPTAPTPLAADNSTAIATTAWVKAQGYGTGGGSFAGGLVTSPITVNNGGTGNLARMASSGSAGSFGSPVVFGADSSSTDAVVGVHVLTKGGGPITAGAALPDGTSANGVARGANAVDLQSSRTGSTQVASGAQAVITGGLNNTASGNQSVVGGGQANLASGTQSVAAGGISNTASGAQSVVAGGNGNAASAVNAVVGGGGSNAANATNAVVCGGSNNTASGQQAAVVGGQSNTVSGLYGWCPGGWFGSNRGDFGRGAWSAGRFLTAGDAQAGEFLLRRQTTDATATRVTADNGAAGAANTINLPNSGTYYLRLMVAARQTGGTGGTAGDSAGWNVTALVRRGTTAASTTCIGVNGASANVGAGLAPAEADTAAAAWRLSVAADTTNGGIAVTVTGEASKTINWIARVMSVELVG